MTDPAALDSVLDELDEIDPAESKSWVEQDVPPDWRNKHALDQVHRRPL